jgi:hypothetical protein
MKNRLILIEGIPGSGKTTIAGKLKDFLESIGCHTELYKEGDSHPADMAWIAYLSLDEYNALMGQYPEFQDRVRNQTKFEDGYALVAYTKLGFHPSENGMMDYFSEHEVYDGKISLEIFRELHLNRWTQFGRNADKDSMAIFECSFLQNHINELMGYHDKDLSYVTSYLKELIDTVKGMNPKLVYLSQPDSYETIKRVAEKRLSPDKERWPDWIDRVIEYVENCPYGQKHSLKGFDGAVRFFDDRKRMELDVIKRLPIETVVIENPDYNWDAVFGMVVKEIKPDM